MTYEEFLEKADGAHAEWVDGEVIEMSPASVRHQDLVDFLTALFRVFTEAKHLGLVRSAPFQIEPATPSRKDCFRVSQKR